MKEFLADILQIERESFDDPWSDQTVISCMERSDYVWSVLRTEDGRVAAYGCANFTPITEGVAEQVGEGEVLRVAVRECYRRSGYGYRVMKELLFSLGLQCVSNVFLEVRSGNTAARQLYEKLGFKEISCRKGYYAGGEDAVVMKLES